MTTEETTVSEHRYSMGNRDLVLVTDDDPRRCSGLNSRYSTRCKRRSGAHPTGLCSTHRHQEYVCRLCGDTHTCEHHGGSHATRT